MNGTAAPVYIRTAGKADLARVRDLLAETWHATYDRLYGPEKVARITGEWHSVEALGENLNRPNSEFLLADDGRQLHGMAFATCEARKITLHQLYVLPGSHRRGIGQALLDEALQCFEDATAVRLEVDPGNESAISFYVANGFAPVGRTENCGRGQSGIPALVFERSLA